MRNAWSVLYDSGFVEENVMRALNSDAKTVIEGWTPAVESMGLTGRNVKRLAEPTEGPQVIR
jgi:hypothetical protein